MVNTTALIIAYFGKIPPFIHLFLKGCEYNKDIDFLFFTDWDWNTLPKPQNVVNRPFSLQQFNSDATEKCGIKINVQTGYKLCDLKPAWPHIFKEHTSNYKFVGYCDIDLIFGRITQFFTEDVKLQADIFTITQTYLSGALTIFRNNDTILKLYQKARGWKEIFQDSRHFAFDEELRINDPLISGGVQSFSSLIFDTRHITLLNKKYIGYEKRPKLVTFDHGIISAEGEEWIFFHYVVAKQSAFWVIPNWTDIPDKFYVNKYGFYRPEQRPVNLIDLFVKSNYRKQIVASLKKKSGTVKKLMRAGSMKHTFKAVIKQFK